MVVLSPRALPDIRLTVDEYLEADLPEGNRYELVKGVVEMPPVPDGEHDEPLSVLHEALVLFRKSHPAAFAHVSQRAAVPIPGGNTVREPDLAVYREWESAGRGWRVWKEFTPVMLVEIVSPEQASRDYRDKREDYWLAGVREYWIVDPQEERVTVLSRGETQWSEAVFRTGQEARSIAIAEFGIPVAQLFQ